MSNCMICDHPPHDGRRCLAAITKDVAFPVGGLIFSRTEVVSNCACGLVDSLVADGFAYQPIDYPM